MVHGGTWQGLVRDESLEVTRDQIAKHLEILGCLVCYIEEDGSYPKNDGASLNSFKQVNNKGPGAYIKQLPLVTLWMMKLGKMGYFRNLDENCANLKKVVALEIGVYLRYNS